MRICLLSPIPISTNIEYFEDKSASCIDSWMPRNLEFVLIKSKKAMHNRACVHNNNIRRKSDYRNIEICRDP